MACAQPMTIKNPNYLIKGSYKWWQQYLEVPCNWCLNCRVDRQNWLTDAMNYEQKKYNYICSFVTFTYDDIHIQELANTTPNDFYYYDDNVFPYNIDRDLVYSLKRDDARKFLKRLRSKINYLYDTHKIKNIDLCRRDFKFTMTGEYGDSFGRPHYHFVFFGLDWQFCKELFESCWQNGLIDCKPVTSGCFQYVTKYLTKQCYGLQAKAMFDDKHIERPFFTHSLGLGKGLILEQRDFIIKNNLCYLTINDTLRPIPIYYRNHFFKIRPQLNYTITNNNMLQSCIIPDLEEVQFYKNSDNQTIRYSLKKMNQYRHDQAILRHSQLVHQCENKGIPINPLIQDNFSSYDYSLVDQVDFALYGDVVPF